MRENRQGKWLAENIEPICNQHHIELYEVAETERRSQVPKEILALLQFCDRPHSQDFLKTALTVLMQRQLIAAQDEDKIDKDERNIKDGRKPRTKPRLDCEQGSEE